MPCLHCLVGLMFRLKSNSQLCNRNFYFSDLISFIFPSLVPPQNCHLLYFCALLYYFLWSMSNFPLNEYFNSMFNICFWNSCTFTINLPSSLFYALLALCSSHSGVWELMVPFIITAAFAYILLFIRE